MDHKASSSMHANRYTLNGSAVCIAIAVVAIANAVTGLLPGVAFLQPDEQLVKRGLNDVTVSNGPGVAVYVPFVTRGIVRKGIKLDERQYMNVKNTLTVEEFTVAGPQLYFLKPHEEVSDEPRNKVVLEKDSYIRLRDAKSGTLRQLQGPAIVVPEPHEVAMTEHPQTALTLSDVEYVVATDKLSGSKRVVTGPALYFPRTPHESVGNIGRAYELKHHQYVRLLDQSTGTLRVERGEAIVFPRPHEQPADGGAAHAVRDAVNVDDETAVLVRSRQTGQQRLVTERGLFVPQPLEEIVEVRKLVRVEPHEVAIVRDNRGAYTFHAGNNSGDDAGTAFHIPPFSELVTMYWSSGTSKEDAENHVVHNAKKVAYKVPVSKIDLRPQYAFFEYKVRTSDNVELLLEGTIFWSVQHVPRMIERTGDPKGDVWYHARSALIGAVSSVSFEQFMASFNTIVSRAAATDSAFYEERGVKLHSLEVTSYECADAKTAGVLQAIIQETTNRINRMQKQKSDNEVEQEVRGGAASCAWSSSDPVPLWPSCSHTTPHTRPSRSSRPRSPSRSSAPRSSKPRRPTTSCRRPSRGRPRARASRRAHSPSSASSTLRWPSLASDSTCYASSQSSRRS